MVFSTMRNALWRAVRPVNPLPDVPRSATNPLMTADPRASVGVQPEAVPAATKTSYEGASPFLAQYLALKERHPGELLFFRMGDFYELFFADAVAASKTLEIALTKRGQYQGADIPMCGVPVHTADSYLARLIRAGHRVAICEQLEDPAEAKKRGSKSIVARDVVRIVTPGTLSEDALLEAGRNNYLAALARTGDGGALALAWLDMSTGDCHVAATRPERLQGELARIRPRELIVSQVVHEDPGLRSALALDGLAVTPLPPARFDSVAGERRIAAHYGVVTLDGFGVLSRAEIAALGALIDYVDLTQKGAAPRLRPPSREDGTKTLLIDPATAANLELTETLSGARAGSLISVIDETKTAAGARLLRGRLLAPACDPAVIGARLDAIDFLIGDEMRLAALRQHLARCPDLARAFQRLALGRGGPRDLGALRDGLIEADAIARRLSARQGDGFLPPPPEIAQSLAQCTGFELLIDALGAALRDELPLQLADGGFVREGYDAALDEFRALRDESRKVVLSLEEKYRGATGIQSLKIRHNNVLGYFIEVTALHADKMIADSGTFLHRQTLANAARFSTLELSSLEQRIAQAGASALAREHDIFRILTERVLAAGREIADAADALAVLDVTAGGAALARARRWTRPLVDDSRAFAITAGRHPVVEAALEADGATPFVPNDCDLSAEDDGARLWLLTGPNMAGKSTFLRQNALIVLLAQMGFFVPADAAHIGIVDRLFSRVGAADDLARGRSTFMVEMVETAAILNQAGPRALVILDEIGRGTATFDGLSIAWAVLEHLDGVNRARGLFATHYHELTALAGKLHGVSAHTMRVKEWKGDVVFLHEVEAGAADRSYGIHVAKLAGLPAAVIERAKTVLTALEAGDDARRRMTLIDDLPLFAAAAKAEPHAAPHPVLARLAEINPDEMTPKEALAVLYALKAAGDA